VLAGARTAVGRNAVGQALGEALRLATAQRASIRSGVRAAAEPQEVPHPDDPSAALPRTSPAGKLSAAQRELISALRAELAFLRRASLYRVLQLAEEATEPDIIVAFGQFAAKWHPDRIAPEASPEMRAIAGEVYELGRSAYEVLIDPVRRGRYLPPAASQPPRSAPRIAAGPSGLLPGPAKTDDETIARIVDALDAGAQAAVSPPVAVDLFEENQELAQARALIERGDHAAARRVLAEILSADEESAPARALVHVLAALEAQKNGRAEEASDEIERALVLDPTCAEALALKREREEAGATERRELLAQVLGKSGPP